MKFFFLFTIKSIHFLRSTEIFYFTKCQTEFSIICRKLTNECFNSIATDVDQPFKWTQVASKLIFREITF